MMSEDMPSWRYLTSASSRITTFRDYLHGSHARNAIRGPRNAPPHPEDQRQSWRAWAGQKMRLARGTSDGLGPGTETINLFPGWAVRRYRQVEDKDREGEFEVEVFVSGFAISHRSAESASRSQRAFIRLAKGFASLPKITADALEPNPEPLVRLTPSTEELLAQKKLPPRPTEITEEYEIDALERHFQRANARRSPGSSRSSSVDSDERTPDIPIPEPVVRNPVTALSADALRKLHTNLESRLQPFWSSAIASRTIRLHLSASPHNPPSPNGRNDSDNADYGPVAQQDVVTAADGSFQARFVVKWEDLCQHPGTLHIAFGDHCEEHNLLIVAQLLSPPASPSSSSLDLETPRQPQVSQTKRVSTTAMMHISITHSPIRVISDIDDTVKLSNVLSGARSVFHNVFVKDLEDNIIPGMGEWYTAMWSHGVRFHYVSNGPFALLPVLSEFFQISQLPPGSIKLKSYAGRSIFNGLLSAPAARKRAGVVEVLDAFPESRFFLIGDTGEQDLELYADLARERPRQVLAVLVRDVETGDPIDDPTGWKAIGAAGTRGPRANSFGLRGSVDDTPRPRRTLSDLLTGKSSPVSTPKTSSPLSSRDSSSTGGDYFTRSPLSAEPEPMPNTAPAVSALLNANHEALNLRTTLVSAGPRLTNSSDSSTLSKSSVSSTSSQPSRMSEAERKRHTLQMRVYVARTQMPGHVPLRVFRDPAECVEVEEIFNKDQQES
ncbi:hypothetical protein D9615_002187 [Tricholomella constricta]|uniref:Phosphatidate phosphatase APP1 catalytic domain-containing protein n=1 Tax=Tricholomella constricta TaxID=117010 RepID=A0A8H5HN94_9AGAR|nr:hypothetical protein D9615_002187 [Tricholomella constricta]